MAKKDSIGSVYLFVGGTLLLSLAWLMPSFPLLAFVGLSPFIAIAANNRKEKSMLSSLELVLLGLAITFFAGTIFTLTQLTYSVIQAILFTLPFIGYTFVRKSLGASVSIITLSLFWLALEYLLLKWSPFPILYLADLLALKPAWTSWNASTGYLGSSLWILMCNTFIYLAILTEKKVSWIYVALFIVSLGGPIAYAYSIESSAITKDEMIQSYASASEPTSSVYYLRGEFITRTSAWVSLLIILFTLVKRKTAKK